MNHLMNVLEGFAQAFTIKPSSRQYIVRENGFEVDRQNLRRDAARVGQDMEQALRKAHGQQGSAGAGNKPGR